MAKCTNCDSRNVTVERVTSPNTTTFNNSCLDCSEEWSREIFTYNEDRQQLCQRVVDDFEEGVQREREHIAEDEGLGFV
jgi:hypothetical protein